MNKLCIVVFNEYAEIFGSSANKEVIRDFERIYGNGYDEECQELPLFDVKPFYKRLVYWFEYKGVYYVFCSARLAQHELGRIEHCIFTLTGLRGVGSHINFIEFLATPNAPMKKFLLKRC